MTGIVEIKIGEEVKQLKYSNYSLQALTEATGKQITELDFTGQSDLESCSLFLYCGLFGYHRANGLVVDFTLDECKKWIDDVSIADQYKMIKEFHSSSLKFTNEMLDLLKLLNSDSEKKN